MGRAFVAAFPVRCADIAIMLRFGAETNVEMQLASAVGAHQQAGEHSLTVGFRPAPPVAAQLLNPLPLLIRNNGLLRIRDNVHIFRGVGIPFLELIGFGKRLEVTGASGILHASQNPHNARYRPAERIFRHRLALPHGVQSLRNRHTLGFQNSGNLARPHPGNRHVKDAAHHGGGLLVHNPRSLVVGG